MHVLFQWDNVPESEQLLCLHLLIISIYVYKKGRPTWREAV